MLGNFLTSLARLVDIGTIYIDVDETEPSMSSHSGGEKPRAVYLLMNTESENLSDCVASVNRGNGIRRNRGREGWVI